MTDEIIVKPDILKPKRGRPTDSQDRRNKIPKKYGSKIVQQRVAGRKDTYSEKEKLNAVCVFAMCGNSRRTAEITKIPEATIRTWKQTEWWNEINHRIVLEQDEELASNLSKTMDKALEQINDRLENGNYIYNAKLDKLVRKPADAKELAAVTAMSLDKRQLLRGQPTSRTERVSQDERLKGLANQFAQFVKAKQVEQVPEEVEEVEEEQEEIFEEELTINEMFGDPDE